MATTVQKNLCVSESGDLKTGTPAPPVPGEEIPDPADLLQAYSELRGRFLRTTNALGSAAHDLKTPLAILNGYVELLQSEKLGPISERQREVLRDTVYQYDMPVSRERNDERNGWNTPAESDQ